MNTTACTYACTIIVLLLDSIAFCQRNWTLCTPLASTTNALYSILSPVNDCAFLFLAYVFFLCCISPFILEHELCSMGFT